jgi:predicted helicase
MFALLTNRISDQLPQGGSQCFPFYSYNEDGTNTNSRRSIRSKELRSPAQLDWRVEKMKLSKDKRSLIYNDFLTLSGIPPEVFEYRLGNRSALDWIIDQHQVSTDKRSGITNDANREDDPQYIVRLIGQVITVSLETTKLVQLLTENSLLANES